jgi:hypothetical protein
MLQTLDWTLATSGMTVTLREYGTYKEAQALVDRLSDVGFPVERVRIVGTGLRGVEQATRGRRDFSSIRGLQAERYAAQVDAGFEAEAARLAGIA